MKPLSALVLAASMALLTPTFSARAQAPAPGQPADGGRRGNFNPEEFRKRMAERMKEMLKVTDEEWTVLQPLVEKVTDKGREVMGGRMGGFGRGPGGPGGGAPGGDRPQGTTGGGDRGPGRAPAPEAQALREVLEKDGASADEIKAKLAAVREQRKKAMAELEAAREELKKVVTARQEAVLVSMGVLD